MENVQKNSSGIVRLLALDAVGNAITDYAAAAADISITDAAGAAYTVSEANWSNGVGLLTVATPDVAAGVKTLTMTVKGNTAVLYPSPFQINLVEPYTGRFNTTNGVVIWDCTIAAAGQATLTDYSGNANTGDPNTGASFPAPVFSNTDTYTLTVGGSAITLGQYKLSWAIPASAGTLGAKVTATKVAGLCDLVSYASLPLKSFGMVWVEPAFSASFTFISLLDYVWTDPLGARKNFALTHDYRSPDIPSAVRVYVNSVMIGTVTITRTAGLLRYLGATLDLNSAGAGTLSVYVNKTKTDFSVNFGSSNSSSTTNRLVIAPTTNASNTGGELAIFDFCAYGAELTATQHSQNCDGWGLS